MVENFRIATGETEGDFDGTVFGDGDFYKRFETAVYTAVRADNRALLDRLEDYIALFARAQQLEGYLSIKQIIGEKQGKGPMRQGDINDFKVCNMGHMFNSACLYFRLTGRDGFLKVAEGGLSENHVRGGRLHRRGQDRRVFKPCIASFQVSMRPMLRG